MKRLVPLLAILAVGLLIGVIGGRMVDSGNPRDAAEAERERQAAFADPSYDAGYAGTASAGGAESFAPAGRSRPDLDWDEEVWPGDGVDYSAGPYVHDEDYFGRQDGGEDHGAGLYPFDDPYVAGAPLSRPGEEAQAALAAELAAQDAARAAARAAPQPATRSRLAESGPPAPPASREPRTADGDLPAIW